MDSSLRSGREEPRSRSNRTLWSNIPSPAAKALGGPSPRQLRPDPTAAQVLSAASSKRAAFSRSTSSRPAFSSTTAANTKAKRREGPPRTLLFAGIRHCLRTVAQEEGTRALWKGLTPFATHLCCKYAVRFGSNAVFEDLFRSRDGKLSHLGRLGAGMGAGIVEALAIVTPFEVIKISLQKQKGLAKEFLKYKGPIHAAKLIVKEEGILGLWKGAAPTVLRNGTNQTSLFFTKPLWDRFLWDVKDGDGKKLASWQSLISGLFAGFLGPILTGPFDVVKTRLMAQEKAGTHLYRGLGHALVAIPREEGIGALWKGLLPRLMRIPPGQAIVWMVRDQVVQFIQQHH